MLSEVAWFQPKGYVSLCVNFTDVLGVLSFTPWCTTETLKDHNEEFAPVKPEFKTALTALEGSSNGVIVDLAKYFGALI